MKIGKYIIEIVPNDSFNHNLSGLPYVGDIYYDSKSDYIYKIKIDHKKRTYVKLFRKYSQICKHIKPNSGIRYSILGKYWIFLVIKQLN